uniref:alpha/beta fold hydrolase n=1 Tax=Salmonella enterica TaxID=28901 RepID=UPI003D767806
MAVEWARNMVHPDRLNDAALMNAIYDMVARKKPEQFAAQIRALLARPDEREVLAAIRCPTLV